MTHRVPVRYRAAFAVTVLGLAFVSMAHREPGSLTTIEWNEASGKTEIIHRLHSHDAELGISSVLSRSGLSVLDIEGRAYIALYVEERFHIASRQGELELGLVGAELAGDHVLVYQDRSGRLPETITVRDDILRDAYPTQVNQVNIKDGDATRSLFFSGDDEWQAYQFQK